MAQRERTWKDEPCVENKDGVLWVNDPGLLAQVASDYFDRGRWTAYQTGDEDGYYDGKPRKWDFLAKYWKRPNGGHYTYLTSTDSWDPMGGSLALTPHKGMRRFYIEENV